MLAPRKVFARPISTTITIFLLSVAFLTISLNTFFEAHILLLLTNFLFLLLILLLHSDRGFQYTSKFFKKFVEDHQIIQSMSRVGKCIDNGPMESFWGIIKEEMYRLKTYETFKDLEDDVKQYIEFYNTKRVT